MKPLLSLCAIPKVADRDQGTGQFAKLLLPGLDHYWFASGAIYAFPDSTLPQDRSMTIHGTNMADTFQKDCCDTCSGH